MPSANAPSDAILLVIRSGNYTRSQPDAYTARFFTLNDTVDICEAMMT